MPEVGPLNRNRAYFTMMGVCLTLVIVRIFSVTAAIIISVAAMAIPPIAAIVANAGDEGSRRL